MGLFGAIGIAASGVAAFRKVLDATSDNISNIHDAAPTSGKAFQARYVVAQSVNYATGEGGVDVAKIQLGGNPGGRVVYEPSHPYADAEGNVRYPDIDLSDQMGLLIIAQRGYEANLAVVDRARTAYEAALQLGRNT